MEKVQKILERAITPDGIDIQIEDWTEVYPDTYKAYNIGCYPIAKRTGRYWLIKKGDKFRCNIENFTDNAKVKEAFELLKSGEKTIYDFERNIIDPRCKYYLGLLEKEPF